MHVGQAEAAADQAAVAEHVFDLFGMGVRNHVEIFRFAAQLQVAHTAAHQISLVAGLAQPVQNFQGVFADLRTGYAVFRARVYPGEGGAGLGRCLLALAEQFFDET